MCCFPYGVYFSKVKRRAKSQSRPLARAQPFTTRVFLVTSSSPSPRSCRRFSIYCRPLAPVHDPGLVGCFVAITSILPSFSRFMVESSSGYSDRSIAKIPGRSTASLSSLLFPRPVTMVSVVEIDVSKNGRSLGCSDTSARTDATAALATERDKSCKSMVAGLSHKEKMPMLCASRNNSIA